MLEKNGLLIILLFLCFTADGKVATDDEISLLAKRCTEQFAGEKIGEVKAVSCQKYDRNLVYIYSVPRSWQLNANAKLEIMESLSSELKEYYFYKDISLKYLYQRNGKTVGEVSISASELVQITTEISSNYYSFKEHPKSKGVNFRRFSR